MEFKFSSIKKPAVSETPEAKPEVKSEPKVEEPKVEAIKPIAQPKPVETKPLPTVNGFEQLSPNVKRTLDHGDYNSLAGSEDMTTFKRLYSRFNKDNDFIDLAKEKRMYEEGDESLFVADFLPRIKGNEDLRMAAKIVASKRGYPLDGSNQNLAEFLYKAGPKTIGEVQSKFFQKARERVMDNLVRGKSAEFKSSPVPKAQKLIKKPEPTGDENKPLDIASLYR